MSNYLIISNAMFQVSIYFISHDLIVCSLLVVPYTVYITKKGHYFRQTRTVSNFVRQKGQTTNKENIIQ